MSPYPLEIRCSFTRLGRNMPRMLILTAAALLIASQTGIAQWLNYPAPGVPRTSDGKVNLAAPVGRAPDGKPDLSGVWSPDNLSYLTYLGADGTPIPMRPWASALLLHRQATKGKEDPDANCTLPG